MNIALAIKETNKSKADVDLEPTHRFRTTVRNLCGLFVNIENGNIYSIHQTAREFLMSKDEAIGPQDGLLHDFWRHSLHPRTSNLILAESCMLYIRLEGHDRLWITDTLPQ